MFHLCPELECNKKYKTKHGLTKHLLEIHQIVDAIIEDPVEITKDNRKRVEEKKNSNKREEQQEVLKKEIEANRQLELAAKEEFRQEQIQKYREIEEQRLEQEMKRLRLNSLELAAKEEAQKEIEAKRQLELAAKEEAQKEIEAKRQLELAAKQEAEEVFRQEQIQRYREIEEQKLEQEIKQLELNDKYLKLSLFIESRIEKNTTDCCICAEKEADTATIPCGHKSFCHECITEYRRIYPNKGCPICREDIVLISKIFS